MRDDRRYIREPLLEKFEFQSYGHALEILSEAFPEEWGDVQDCLERLSISVEDLQAAGGNETAIPKSSTTFWALWAGGKSASPGICW